MEKMSKVLIFALIGVVFLAGCIDQSTKSTKISESPTKQIVDKINPEIRVIQITNDINAQYNPQIYNDVVAWIDKRNGNEDIFIKNITSGETRQITLDETNENTFGIYGDKIVYFGKPMKGMYEFTDIYVYDIKTGRTKKLTCDGWIRSNLKLSNGIAVFYSGSNVDTPFWINITSTEECIPDRNVTVTCNKPVCESFYDKQFPRQGNNMFIVPANMIPLDVFTYYSEYTVVKDDSPAPPKQHQIFDENGGLITVSKSKEFIISGRKLVFNPRKINQPPALPNICSIYDLKENKYETYKTGDVSWCGEIWNDVIFSAPYLINISQRPVFPVHIYDTYENVIIEDSQKITGIKPRITPKNQIPFNEINIGDIMLSFSLALHKDGIFFGEYELTKVTGKNSFYGDLETVRIYYSKISINMASNEILHYPEDVVFYNNYKNSIVWADARHKKCTSDGNICDENTDIFLAIIN